MKRGDPTPRVESTTSTETKDIVRNRKFPQFNDVKTRGQFRVWLEALLTFKLRYYIPDSILWTSVDNAAQKVRKHTGELDDEFIGFIKSTVYRAYYKKGPVDYGQIIEVTAYEAELVDSEDVVERVKDLLSAKDKDPILALIHANVTIRNFKNGGNNGKREVTPDNWKSIWIIISEYYKSFIPEALENYNLAHDEDEARNRFNQLMKHPYTLRAQARFKDVQDHEKIWRTFLKVLIETIKYTPSIESLNEGKVDKLENQVESQINNNQNNKRSKQQKCVFCESTEHTFKKCDQVPIFLENKKIFRNHKDKPFLLTDEVGNKYNFSFRNTFKHQHPELFKTADAQARHRE